MGSMKDAPRRRPLVRPRHVLLTGLVLIIVVSASAYLELRQIRQDLMQVHIDEGRTLLETIKHSASNSIEAQMEVEDQLAERLFNNARLLRELEKQNEQNKQKTLTSAQLRAFAAENNLYRINIFDPSGRKVVSNAVESMAEGAARHQPRQFFQPILDGEVSEIDIGLKQARFLEGDRYAVAVRRENGGVIVVNVDAAQILAFRQRIGLGKLIEKMSAQPELEYIVVQDEDGILAASPNVTVMSAVVSDPFLNADSVRTRLTDYEGREVLEAVSPFVVNGVYLGMLRVGLHLNELRTLEKRMFRRAVLISGIFVFIGFILINWLMINQSYTLLRHEHGRLQTYTGNILESMADAVITVDRSGSIQFANRAAGKLLGVSAAALTGHPLSDFLQDADPLLAAIHDPLKTTLPVCTLRPVSHSHHELLEVSVQLSKIRDANDEPEATVILMHDLTRQRQLEAQLQRQEKLSAMGELASGVAHEIRNPLNAVSMIVQRFQKEFEPQTDADEYRELTHTVRAEIKRIGEIIQQFLTFARPPALDRSRVPSTELIEKSVQVVSAQAAEKGVEISTVVPEPISLWVDRDQMHQALLNLLQNALDATPNGGRITISTDRIDDNVHIRIQDTGHGIESAQLKRIFDLYYTTKPNGTGLGLALVHRIVHEHDGQITVESQPGVGTTFLIILPISE